MGRYENNVSRLNIPDVSQWFVSYLHVINKRNENHSYECVLGSKHL